MVFCIYLFQGNQSVSGIYVYVSKHLGDFCFDHHEKSLNFPALTLKFRNAVVKTKAKNGKHVEETYLTDAHNFNVNDVSLKLRHTQKSSNSHYTVLPHTHTHLCGWCHLTGILGR